ncbi:MgtC/SapB family protein [Roseateles sp.]|uniref:MgtC/SapB family protein n=1 Tax=Roseateles sp. TaxID=1971397 RepID=UPI0039E978DC
MSIAMLLGWVIGYERFFSGRAAGSQVYCIVCATAAAINLLAGHPELWYGGGGQHTDAGDPTRVTNAIMTGIGFLGAGIIVQTGLNVRGLTTAASIWGSAAIGILVGVGFYLPAFGLTAIFVAATELVPRLERKLPSRTSISGTFVFREGYKPRAEAVQRYLETRGLRIPGESIMIGYKHGRFELQCMILALNSPRAEAISKIASELVDLPEMESFHITPSSRT